MLAYDRRAKRIRRMQDRAARRRERTWARRATLASTGMWDLPGRDHGAL